VKSANSAAFIFGVVCEGKSDQRIARGLAHRVLVEKVDWLDETQVENLCRWQGVEKDYDFLPWPSVEKHAKNRKLRVHGGLGGKFDERRARTALFLFNDLASRPDAVVFVRDTDAEERRRPSIEQACEAVAWPFPVVVATPHTKRECWLLNGFEPADADEEAALREARQKLGFHPCKEAEKLTGKRRSKKKNAKSVLEKDLGVKPDSLREDACWRRTDLSVLRERGSKTLLADYLAEVAERLAPLLSGGK